MRPLDDEIHAFPQISPAELRLPYSLMSHFIPEFQARVTRQAESLAQIPHLRKTSSMGAICSPDEESTAQQSAGDEADTFRNSQLRPTNRMTPQPIRISTGMTIIAAGAGPARPAADASTAIDVPSRIVTRKTNELVTARLT